MPKRTEYYCPECGRQERSVFLTTDGRRFACPDCLKAYSPAELAGAYRNELEGLESDALYLRGNLERLENTCFAGEYFNLYLQDTRPHPAAPGASGHGCPP